LDFSDASKKIPSDTTGNRSGELPTSRAATNLLVKEIDFTKTSTAASTNRNKYMYDYARFSSFESNGDGTNNWKPVKNSYSDIIRHKNTQQLNTIITLSSSFAVLDNLYESPDKSTTNILKVHKALRAQTNRPKPPKKHSVFLVADSHISGVAVRLATLRYSFRTIGYVKPTADINSIT
jgi:hypothetical protein